LGKKRHFRGGYTKGRKGLSTRSQVPYERGVDSEKKKRHLKVIKDRASEADPQKERSRKAPKRVEGGVEL